MFDDDRSNLKLNWWPATGVLELVGDPEVRPDVQQQLLGQGAVARGGSPADFASLIAEDRKKYARIILENKLSAD